jgi:hypothetical protein
MKNKTCQPPMPHIAKIYFKSEGEIKTFRHLKEKIIIFRPAIQKI